MKLRLSKRCRGGLLVGSEIHQRLRNVGVFDDGHAVIGRQSAQKRVGSLQVAAFEKINGRAGFDQHEGLRGFLNGQKIGDGLLDAVIEDVKIFALQAFDKFSGGIANRNADVNAIDADANRLRLLGGA